jgi:acetylornithine aminotransferase
VSEQWLERYTAALMPTFGLPQRVLVRGLGARVWDADGKEYLDLLGGIAVNALGHAHPAILTAVTEQLTTLGHVSNFFTSVPQVRLAERLVTLADAGAARVFFTNSGAEAVEAGFKATRKTGRTKLVAAEGSFHGRTMGALALTSKAAYREPFEPLPGEVTFMPYGDADALASAVDDQTAALVLEPIQGEAGVIVAPQGYLKAAREIADQHGALLWLDEIQTGIGRTGVWFEHHRSGVRPDLITVAKGLGGGLPIGACIGVGEAGELLGPGQHGTTFGGNPVSCAAALAVIDTIGADGLLDHVEKVGAHLRAALTAHPMVTEVTGRGLLLGVVLADPVAVDARDAALAAGLIVNAPTPDRLRLAPPLTLTMDEADEAIAKLSQAVAQVRS